MINTEEYDAVVYDLDGTLVRLAVDWELAARDATSELAKAGIDAAGLDLWNMLDLDGAAEVVRETISEHERAGARESERLPGADHLETLDRPAAVCSLNCEAACRIALEQHGLTAEVTAVVGRDTVATRKPAPEPLLAAIEELPAAPERTLFVGDSERDEEASRRAGVPFAYVGDGPSGQ